MMEQLPKELGEKIDGGQKVGTNKDSSGLATSSLLGRGR